MKSKQRVLGALGAQVMALALCSVAVNADDGGASGGKEMAAKETAAKQAQGSTALYQVKDGNKVDPQTLMGWKTWRALACERCHGAEQEGLVGPSLVQSLKVLSKEEFHSTIMNGRPEKGMPPFNTSEMVNKNWEGLYAYLKGRSDGQIQPGRLSPIE